MLPATLGFGVVVAVRSVGFVASGDWNRRLPSRNEYVDFIFIPLLVMGVEMEVVFGKTQPLWLLR